MCVTTKICVNGCVNGRLAHMDISEWEQNSGTGSYSIQEMFEALNRKWDEAPCPFDLLHEAGALKEGCQGTGCPCGSMSM